MAGQLITLPVRLWWRGAMLLLHTAEDATELALGATLRVAGALENLRGGSSPTEPDHPPVFTEPAPPPSRGTEREGSERGNGNGAGPELASERLAREGFTTSVDLTDPGSEPVQEPAHVSEEPVLVEEIAEPGAEEGAGASVHVQEPWEGYQRMNAREVIARCGEATMAELVAVQLYESGHRNRQTVLEAVARAMKSPGRTL
jgi:hypothetical protein